MRETKRHTGIVASLKDVVGSQRGEHRRRLRHFCNPVTLHHVPRGGDGYGAGILYRQRDGASPCHLGRDRLQVVVGTAEQRRSLQGVAMLLLLL